MTQRKNNGIRRLAKPNRKEIVQIHKALFILQFWPIFIKSKIV